MVNSDTLHRHELSHHGPGSEGGKDHTHRITVKTFRACFSCATARVRCSGGKPCGRCDTRSLECQYPTERRSKARINNEASRRLYTVDERAQVENAASQPSPLPVDGLNEFHLSPKMSVHNLSNLREAHPATISSSERGAAAATNPELHRPPSNASTQMPLDVYPHGDGSHSYGEISNPDMSRLFSLEQATGISAGMNSLPSDMTSSSMDMGMALDFDPSLFDQSMLSTINWLPNNFLTGASNEQSPSAKVSAQFSQPPLDAYTDRTAWQPPVINIDPSTYDNISQTPSGHRSLGTELGSPRRFSHVFSEASPNSEPVDSAKRSADSYVDGGGARLPKYRKKNNPWSTSSIDTSAFIDARRFGFPSLQEIHVEHTSDEAMRSIRPIEQTTHDEIHRNFLLLCRNDNPFFEMFDSENFPTAEICTQYLACFFDSFQTVYPIFHPPTFDPNQCHWLVTLAIVSVGCHSSGIREIDQCSAAFYEMIRRAIYVEVSPFALV